MNVVFSLIAAYLLGSIPTAYIFAKMYKGVDIRQHGSGNVGATNAFRVLGKGPGTLVLLIDILKGVLATAVVPGIFGFDTVTARVVLAIVAVAGHNWTVFLQFKGGKGIATSLGVLIGLTIAIPSIRPVLLTTLLAWAIIFFSSGYVSLASIVAAIILPFGVIFTHQPLPVCLLGAIFCLWVVIRHRPNIRRLLAGEESRAPLPYLKNK